MFWCLDSKKAQKDEKLVFQEKRRKCRPTYNNDDTRIVRKIRFRSSFKKTVRNLFTNPWKIAKKKFIFGKVAGSKNEFFHKYFLKILLKFK